MDPVLTEVNQKVQTNLDHFKHELSSIRAGRANPSLIEEIPVEAYGAKMKLVEVGTISAPQPNLLTIQIWDSTIMQSAVKAIQESNLGLNPSFEGQIIRLAIPPLTAERRQEYIKLVHQKAEETKISLRQIRQEIREEWEEDQKNGNISEDEFDRRAKILQELLDKTASLIEETAKEKEEELIKL